MQTIEISGKPLCLKGLKYSQMLTRDVSVQSSNKKILMESLITKLS